MRLLILAAATALTLAACRNNDQHDTTTNVDENLTAENIVANDVTAIDAVTADAANMAADVNYTALPNEVDNETNAEAPTNAPAQQPKPAPATPRPQPTTNTAATTNGTE